MDLTSGISALSHIGPAYEKKLAKLGIKTIKDLLYYCPSRYLDYSVTIPLWKIPMGEVVTIKGRLTFIKNQYTKSGRKMQVGVIRDEVASLKIVWFNQPFLTRVLFPGDLISLSGKVDWIGREKAIISPEYEKAESSLHTGRLVPVYPETAGLSSKWLRTRINEAFPLFENQLIEYLPDDYITKFKLLDIKTAIKAIHFPENNLAAKDGRKRLAFEELLRLHLESLTKKHVWIKDRSTTTIKIKNKTLTEYLNSFPFELTSSQNQCIKEILKDLAQPKPMNRLLEGDVGSGKTVVASVGILAAYLKGYQSVVMAPTQILAMQHFQTLKEIFSRHKLNIGLLVGNRKLKSIHKYDLIIGTHALLNQREIYKRVAYIVIDEQHKFGVDQRNLLIKNTERNHRRPHVLTMTATPIPRTIALTLYGDMDLSVLTEMPEGRIRPSTWLVPPEKKGLAFKWIENTITKKKYQAFFIYPLIDKSDSQLLLNIKAVTTEYQEIIKSFKKHKIGLMHGRLKPTEKEKVITDFKKGKLDILVSTPVIEVGIDVPSANIIVIESADRFGLAQLHQLRGRVGRSDVKAYCLLLTESSSQKVLTRLEVLKKARSGFELAEKDLSLRGPGEIFGSRQHGFPELKIASWQDIDLIKSAQATAKKIFQDNSLLKRVLGNPFLNRR